MTTSSTVNPGDPVSSTGILTSTSGIGSLAAPVTEDLSAGGNLTLQVSAYTTAGAGFDQQILSGLSVLRLGGSSTLTLDLAGLAAPVPGAATAAGVVTYAGIEGTFSSINYVNDPLGLVANVSYNAGQLNLTFAGAATHFAVTSTSSSTIAGGGIVNGPTYTTTVTALDQFGNTAFSYSGTVLFKTSDPASQPPVVLPGVYAFTTGQGTSFDNGVHVFTNGIELVTAGTQTITTTDSANSNITGNSAVTVIPGATTHFSVVASPATYVAGKFLLINVTALDRFNNINTNNTGIVHFSSTDPNTSGQTVLADDATLTNGVGNFAAILTTAGVQTISATDQANDAGVSNNITVTPGSVNKLSVSAPTNATPALTFSIGVTAQDRFGNIVPGYVGTVHFTSSDGSATLPADSTLTSGSSPFSVTLRSAGTQRISASDLATPSLTGSASVLVSASTIDHFLITTTSATAAGSPIAVFVTAEDAFNNTVVGYANTVHFSSTDPQAVLPADTVLTNGVGAFGALLRTAGNQTITVTQLGQVSPTGTSSNISVSALGIGSFFIGAPATAITGQSFPLTVIARDQFGNTVTGFTGSVTFSSSDAAAILPNSGTGVYTFTAADHGLHVFSVASAPTLQTPGNQSFTVTDGTHTGTSNPNNSSPITTRGLTVSSLTPTPTGFVAVFDKAFNPSVINLYDASGSFGADDVLLTSASSPQVSFHGSLFISPNDQTITFVKTSNFTGAGFDPSTGVLSAGTYTVTFRSASNGFKDSLGAPLDGANSGNPIGSNYVATFVVAAAPPVVVGIPAFARGPNNAAQVQLPNNLTEGIPIDLSNGNGVTQGKFTLQYNSSLLSITGVAVNTALTGATLSLDAASTAGTAILDFSSTTPVATSAGAVGLGGLVATVPNSASLLYKSKALLHWSGEQLNGGAIAVEGDDAIQVVAFFGDASGDGTLSGGDASDISAVATGTSTNAALGTLGGFTAFQLADPVIVGDLSGNGNVDAPDVTLINSFLSGTPRPQVPAIPTGLVISPTGPDPVLSLPTTLQALPGGTVVVPVNIDTAKPDGSTGATEAVLALQYNPQVFSVSASDVQAGSLTTGTGWQLTTVVNAQTGEIGIDIFSSTPIQTTAAGSLVTITLHEKVGSNAGSAVTLAPISLVSQVDPSGQRAFKTTVADNQGDFIIHFSSGQVAAGSEQPTAGIEQPAVESEQMAVGNVPPVASNNTADMQFTDHSTLPTAYYLEQAFSEIDPMLTQESMVAQPGAILNTELNEQSGISGSDKAMVQPLSETQHDWVSPELLEHLGQSGRNQLGTLDDADLAGLEAFFAKDGISSFGA